mgnify:CR=1 FL=1
MCSSWGIRPSKPVEPKAFMPRPVPSPEPIGVTEPHRVIHVIHESQPILKRSLGSRIFRTLLSLITYKRIIFITRFTVIQPVQLREIATAGLLDLVDDVLACDRVLASEAEGRRRFESMIEDLRRAAQNR